MTNYNLYTTDNKRYLRHWNDAWTNRSFYSLPEEAVLARNNVAEMIRTGDFGWAGIEAADDAYAQLRTTVFTPFIISNMEADGKAGPPITRRVALWDAVRKVFGHDCPNYPQEVGSCVGFGKKNAEEYLQCQEIVAGDRETFHLVHEPYGYGCARECAGMSGGDGCTGAGAAEAAMKYGVLPADISGAPPYSGSLDRSWGNRPWVPSKYKTDGQQHVVKAAARISTEQELLDALLITRCPVTIASGYGYSMEPDAQGFHRPGPRWSHQMCIVYANIEHAIPHIGILNSWGDVHGHLNDLTTNEPWPVGTLRVRLADAVRHVTNGEAYVYSNFQGFPAKRPDYRIWV